MAGGVLAEAGRRVWGEGGALGERGGWGCLLPAVSRSWEGDARPPPPPPPAAAIGADRAGGFAVVPGKDLYPCGEGSTFDGAVGVGSTFDGTPGAGGMA